MTDQEINEAVARELGWTKHPDGQWNRSHECGGEVVLWKGLPDYCHSIEAAWEVVENLSKNSWIMVLEQHGLGLPHYAVRFSKIPYSDKETSHAIADTAPMAICLAFLKLP